MKVLFLDIDGVLNSSRTSLAFGGYPFDFASDMDKFDAAAIALIRRMCDAGDVKIVLSSFWRTQFTHDVVARELRLPIIDATPVFWGQPRGAEIAVWLERNPEVEHYAIVDDDADMLPGQEPFFVRTNGNEGLSYADFTKLCAILQVNALNAPAPSRHQLVEDAA